MSKQYQKAGVSLQAGYQSVELIKKHINSTKRSGWMGGIGSFGGMFDLASLGYKQPVLVSGTDGVGTKLLIAMQMDKHDTIGIDLVAMCVNDVLAQGAQPLFFLDYIATAKTDPYHIESIVSGIAEGCRQANCALIGGETAEMPDMYQKGHYDLAGFTVGVVEKDKLLSGSKVRVGDAIVGLASSGIHSNGFSLVRKIILKDNNLDLNKNYGLEKTLGQMLLTPTKIYIKPMLKMLKKYNIAAIMHITGGGFIENLPRGVQEDQGILIRKGTWEVLPIFDLLQKYGNIDEAEMYEVFNMGIGLAVILPQKEAASLVSDLINEGEKAYIIGEVTNRKGVEIS